jgi:hypothetical protein
MIELPPADSPITVILNGQSKERVRTYLLGSPPKRGAYFSTHFIAAFHQSRKSWEKAEPIGRAIPHLEDRHSSQKPGRPTIQTHPTTLFSWPNVMDIPDNLIGYKSWNYSSPSKTHPQGTTPSSPSLHPVSHHHQGTFDTKSTPQNPMRNSQRHSLHPHYLPRNIQIQKQTILTLCNPIQRWPRNQKFRRNSLEA